MVIHGESIFMSKQALLYMVTMSTMVAVRLGCCVTGNQDDEEENVSIYGNNVSVLKCIGIKGYNKDWNALF